MKDLITEVMAAVIILLAIAVATVAGMATIGVAMGAAVKTFLWMKGGAS